MLNDSDAFLNDSYEETDVYNVTRSIDPYRHMRDLLSTKVRSDVKDPYGRLTFGNICSER